MASLALREASEALRRQQSSLAEELVIRQFAARPELTQNYGPTGREKCLQDANYHLAYLTDAMNAGEPALFANYVEWAGIMLANRGIPTEDLARHLDLTRTLVADRMSREVAILATQYIDGGLVGLLSRPTTLPTNLPPDRPHAVLAQSYLGALLKGERHVASRLILEAVAGGVPVKEIYLHVFQPVQYEVGRMWQLNEINVAQEHYCTAATQLIMSQLYAHIFATDKGAGTFVATCAAGDLHELGIRMLADFFELDGWNTFYLGASMPPQAVVEAVVQRKAQVLGISVTMVYHLRAVEELIEKVRSHPACYAVKILVGGSPFLVAPELWRKMGADGCAHDAQAAIVLANRLIAEGGGNYSPPSDIRNPEFREEDREFSPGRSGETQIQDDLSQFNNELINLQRELAKRNQELENALREVKTLQGMIPICSQCKKIRDETAAWLQLETYVQAHSDVRFSHGLCPECTTAYLDDLNKLSGKKS